ncbi:hypothetical protein BH09BAC5_BH09BAC5_12420 [soil metagenome]
MSITVNKNSTIEELQQNFRNRYPFLRLDFFKSEKTVPLAPHQRKFENNISLETIAKPDFNGTFVINPDDKVGNVEKLFRKAFDADVQVMRHSGTSWLITTQTDDYTLLQQNEIGKEMATAPEKPEPEDIHEQE